MCWPFVRAGAYFLKCDSCSTFFFFFFFWGGGGRVSIIASPFHVPLYPSHKTNQRHLFPKETGATFRGVKSTRRSDICCNMSSRARRRPFANSDWPRLPSSSAAASSSSYCGCHCTSCCYYCCCYCCPPPLPLLLQLLLLLLLRPDKTFAVD